MTLDGPDHASNKTEDTIPLLDHFKELRLRLLISLVFFLLVFIIGLVFADWVFNFLVQPLQDRWGPDSNRGMIYTALQEKFLTDIKLAFFAAMFVGFPFMASQLWSFIAPGLYRREKQAFLPFLVMTPVFFWIGAAFVYYVVMPAAWGFFLTYEQLPTDSNDVSVIIQLQPKVSEYLNLTIGLILAFGFSFELPVLLSLLVKAHILKVSTLKKNRRIAIVLAFVMAAVLTPPDPISQLMLAIPLILLYECSIWFGTWIEKRRSESA